MNNQIELKTMLSIEQFIEQIMLLPKSDRVLLAERIIESLSAEINPAVELRQQLLEIACKIDDRYIEAHSLFNQALRLATLYQYWEAREKLRQAKQLFAAIELDDMVEKCNKKIKEFN